MKPTGASYIVRSRLARARYGKTVKQPTIRGLEQHGALPISWPWEHGIMKEDTTGRIYTKMHKSATNFFNLPRVSRYFKVRNLLLLFWFAVLFLYNKLDLTGI